MCILLLLRSTTGIEAFQSEDGRASFVNKSSSWDCSSATPATYGRRNEPETSDLWPMINDDNSKYSGCAEPGTVWVCDNSRISLCSELQATVQFGEKGNESNQKNGSYGATTREY